LNAVNKLVHSGGTVKANQKGQVMQEISPELRKAVFKECAQKIVGLRTDRYKNTITVTYQFSDLIEVNRAMVQIIDLLTDRNVSLERMDKNGQLLT
jgi:hypothetical protein